MRAVELRAGTAVFGSFSIKLVSTVWFLLVHQVLALSLGIDRNRLVLTKLTAELSYTVDLPKVTCSKMSRFWANT